LTDRDKTRGVRSGGRRRRKKERKGGREERERVVELS
jgi:hypothetical protein